MTKTLKTFALSALAGLTALAAIPSAANADELYRRHRPNVEAGIVLEFGNADVPRSGIVINRYPHKRHGNRHDLFESGFVVRKAPRCSIDQAVWKAEERFGLHRVRVEYANKHVIGIEGKKRGKWREIVFSRAPGCPVIDY